MADFNTRGPDCDDDCEGERGERGKRGKRGHRGHDGERGHAGHDGAAGATGPTGPAATDDDDEFVLVFRPGGVAEDNVYTSWPAIVAALSAIEGTKVLQFDDSIVSPVVIPPGVWDMTSVEWFALYENTTGDLVQVQVGDGITDATFINLRQISGKLAITNLNNTTAPVTVLTTGAPNRVFFQLGFGPMGDNPQIQNNGAAPFFDASGLMLGQQFVLRMAGQISGSSPAIQFGNSPGTMALNLGGARIDANMIAGINSGAFMNIGYTTGSVAFAQQQLWAGRIQRGRPDAQTAATARGFTPFFRTLMFPPRFNHQQAVPTPPSSAPTGLSTPALGQGHNVTMRLNASGGNINQTLPIIRAIAPPIGAQPNVTAGVLDSDGMIVIVKEFSGALGATVTLTPSPGESIEGVPGGSIVVPPGGSRILQSDGVSDWRIIAGYL